MSQSNNVHSSMIKGQNGTLYLIINQTAVSAEDAHDSSKGCCRCLLPVIQLHFAAVLQKITADQQGAAELRSHSN